MKRFFLIGLAMLCSLAMQAQMESRLACRRYTTQDGLPQMQTERVWQDTRGYIYIGTLSGFVRFDGREFTPFLKGRRENIVGFAEVEGQVHALGFPRQWLVGYDEVKMHPIDPEGHWLLNNLNAGSLPNGYVILEDEHEQDRRLCRTKALGFDTVLAHPLLDEMTPDRKLCIDSLGAIVPTQKGVFLLKKGQKQATILTTQDNIYTLLRTPKGLLAFASDGIYLLRDEKTKRPAGANKTGAELMVQADWSTTAFGLTVRQFRNGDLAIADEHTIYRYDGQHIEQLFTGINLIRDVLVDRWDRLWVATYQGAYCFFNRCFTTHQLSDENDIFRALAADSTGRMVAGTLNGKVLCGSQLISDQPDLFYAPCGASVNGQVFLSMGSDVACLNENNELQPLGLPQDRYRFMTVVDGKLVLVSPQAISTYDPASCRFDTLTTAIPYAWCAASDGRGHLWVGTTLGLYSIDAQGTVKQKPLECRRTITAMAGDEVNGCAFFASADSLFMIERANVVELSQQLPQLASHEVRSLHVSPKGYLVVAVIDGLLVARIEKTANSGVMLKDASFFDQRNGFTLLCPQQAAMAETPDGTVWVAGLEQMMSFRPADLLASLKANTFIAPPLRWWQHWWVWAIGLLLLTTAVWAITRRIEKHRNRKKMIRLQQKKLQREQQIDAIRKKAIEAAQNELAKDIMKLTEENNDDRLALRTSNGTIVVNISDIAYFKGNGNYSQLVAFTIKETVLISLGTLERTLPPETFVRADRSSLVNIHNIARLLPKERRCIFRSANGEELETTLLAPAFTRLQELL